MPDIFLSYSRIDKGRVEIIGDTLKAMGWTVWWDDQIPTASRFEDVLEKMIHESKAILVCWSKHSCISSWVEKEAKLANTLNKYVPITLDGTVPPDGFSAQQTTNLRNWYGGVHWPGLSQVMEKLAELIGKENNYSDIDEVFDYYKTNKRIAVGWYVISLIAFIYSASMWIAIQTVGKAATFLLIEPDPVKGALVTLGIILLLMIPANVLLYHFSLRQRNEDWVTRIPRLSFSKPDMRNVFVRIEKKVVLFFMTFIPMASLIHFSRKAINNGKVVYCDKSGINPKMIEDYWHWIPDFHELFHHVYCFAGTDIQAARDGVSFIPFLEPYLMLGLFILCWFHYLRAIINVFQS